MDDLIKRQAAIDAIKTWGLLDGLSEGQAIEILADEEKLPSAQPDSKELSFTHKALDCISRQDAIDAVYKCADIFAGDMPVMVVKADAYEALAQLPSAQPDIIRCKDCKHWLDIDDGRQKHRMCADVYGDWFCADAERRTTDG